MMTLKKRSWEDVVNCGKILRGSAKVADMGVNGDSRSSSGKGEVSCVYMVISFLISLMKS